MQFGLVHTCHWPKDFNTRLVLYVYHEQTACPKLSVKIIQKGHFVMTKRINPFFILMDDLFFGMF
jgi:hypothetical protein